MEYGIRGGANDGNLNMSKWSPGTIQLALPKRVWPRSVSRILLTADQGEGGSAWTDVAIADARRIADRLEIHHTPKHGSWLNMAEIDRTVLQRQCLDRRLADRSTLAREVAAWVAARNATG